MHRVTSSEALEGAAAVPHAISMELVTPIGVGSPVSFQATPATACIRNPVSGFSEACVKIQRLTCRPCQQLFRRLVSVEKQAVRQCVDCNELPAAGRGSRLEIGVDVARWLADICIMT
jgi:hypothetical protein